MTRTLHLDNRTISVLMEISKSLQKQTELLAKYYEFAMRPRPIFQDYDSGYADGVAAARSETENVKEKPE